MTRCHPAAAGAADVVNREQIEAKRTDLSADCLSHAI
jgi:hypothetical protein